jgi:DNA polymerase
MTFFQCYNKTNTVNSVQGYSFDFLHRGGCAVCPLKNTPNYKTLKTPHMEPSGSIDPIVYCLGEAPGGEEDKVGEPFIGPAGQVLRFRIPEEWEAQLRFNNCVRTRPEGNRDPTPMELECCRPSIIGDIEMTQPTAIFGFGNVPLRWALKRDRITKWCGRRIPIKVGQHTCWFFPMMHPSYILRSRKFIPNDTDAYGSE